MSEPIKAGDLVVIIRAHCEEGARDWLGRIRTVKAVRIGGNGICAYCDHPVAHDGRMASFVEGLHHPASYLKRIPPLEELEGEKREEKLLEPV